MISSLLSVAGASTDFDLSSKLTQVNAERFVPNKTLTLNKTASCDIEFDKIKSSEATVEATVCNAAHQNPK